MTRLTKPVRRVGCRPIEQGRPPVIVLEPGDMIALRLKGTRTTFRLTIETAYHLAVKLEVRARQLAKAQAKRSRR
jgi:hypothetical protein